MNLNSDMQLYMGEIQITDPDSMCHNDAASRWAAVQLRAYLKAAVLDMVTHVLHIFLPSLL